MKDEIYHCWLFHVCFGLWGFKRFTLQVLLSLVQNAMCMQLMLRHHCSRAIVVKIKAQLTWPVQAWNTSQRVYFLLVTANSLVSSMKMPNLFSYHAMNVNPHLLIYIGPGSTTLYCFISLHHLHRVSLVYRFQSKTMLLLHKPHCLVWHIIIYW